MEKVSWSDFNPINMRKRKLVVSKALSSRVAARMALKLIRKALTKEHTKMMRDQVMEYLLGLTVVNTRVLFLKTKCTASVNFMTLKETSSASILSKMEY